MEKYRVDRTSLEDDKISYFVRIFLGVFLVIGSIIFFKTYHIHLTLLVGLLWFGLCSTVGIFSAVYYIRIVFRLKVIDDLCINGTLIKNLPYRVKVKNTGDDVYSKTYVRIFVDYTTGDGKVLHLKSDKHYGGTVRDKDGRVDLLIDENNPKHYFIDFNIGCAPGVSPSYDAFGS